MMRVFIGYDRRQPAAFYTLAHSIWNHASRSISITPLRLEQLSLTRTGLTEFTYSRFLVPHLASYEGISLFVDSDFLCRSDVLELLAYPMAFPEHAVFVVKGPLQFEWPSLMLFQNSKCGALTPEYVKDTAHGLFDFAWAESVGELPAAWNHLVGYQPPNPNAKMVHFTQGVPCWPETQDSEHAEAWKQTASQVMTTVSFRELMGRSVHAKPVYERLRKAAEHV